MDQKKRTGTSIVGFIARTKQDHVGAYAAQAAYFLILSFIPFVLFLMTLVKYTPLTYHVVKEAFSSILPENVQGFVMGIVSEVFNKSTAMVPITGILALWSAGKGLQSLTNGLNTIYHVKETRNWLMTRIWAVLYTLLFSLSLVASLILLVFGNSIQKYLQKYIPLVAKMLSWLIGAKTFLVFLVLMVVFLLLYKVLPNRRASLKSQMPGAVLTAIAWSAFSYFFSLYFEFFPSFSNMYGSLTAVIMVMLWMYVCMNIVLYGAEVNAYYENEFRKAQAFARDLFDKEKPEHEKDGERLDDNGDFKSGS
ncbi:MAG: YihY/virulence factor BrkB family protein [Blautia sp.]|jgi:membrane protein